MEIKYRSVTEITNDSPDNNIESRKKRTAIKITVDPVGYFVGCEWSALLCVAGLFEDRDKSLDEKQVVCLLDKCCSV